MVDRVLVSLDSSGRAAIVPADLSADELFAQIRAFNSRGVSNLNLEGVRLTDCGLPMICIPSRATQGMIVQLSPTPFAHEVTA